MMDRLGLGSLGYLEGAPMKYLHGIQHSIARWTGTELTKPLHPSLQLILIITL